MESGRETVSYEMMLVGYADALHRFDTVAEESNPIKAYPPLFEALSWAVSLDDRIGDDWRPDGGSKALGPDWRERLGLGAEVMAGVRFARNRVHHQWANAVMPEGGFGDQFVQWVWKPTDDLPESGNRSGEDTYREKLERRPIRASLDVLNGAFWTLQFLLEPHTIRQHWRREDLPFSAPEPGQPSGPCKQ